MKKVAIGLALLFLCGLTYVWAQSDEPAEMPQTNTITCQGRISNIGGEPLAGDYEVTFALYDGEAEEEPIWAETQTVSAHEGLFSVNLGQINPISLPFGPDYWLGISVEDEQLLPRYKLTSLGAAYRLTSGEHSVGKSTILEGLSPIWSDIAQDIVLGATGVQITADGNLGDIGDESSAVQGKSQSGHFGIEITAVEIFPHPIKVETNEGNFAIEAIHTGGGNAIVAKNNSASPTISAKNDGQGIAVKAEGGNTGVFGKGAKVGVYGETGGFSILHTLGRGVAGIGPNSGVYGVSTTGKGVEGTSDATGVYGWGGTYGVHGKSDAGIGVKGISTGGGKGVWGKGTIGVFGEGSVGVKGSSATGTGVEGIGAKGIHGHSVGNGYAGYFEGKTKVIGDLEVGYSIVIGDTLITSGAGVNIGEDLEVAGHVHIVKNLYVDGTLYANNAEIVDLIIGSCDGCCCGGMEEIATTGVNASRIYEDFGSAELGAGEAIIPLEESLAEAITATEGYHVFLTPNGDCNGLYVAEKNPDYFVVKELQGGAANVMFDYRVVVKAKGYQAISIAEEKETAPAISPVPARDTERLAELQRINEKRRQSAQEGLARLKERFMRER